MGQPLVRRAGALDDETGLLPIPLSVLLLDTIGPEYIWWTSEALHAELVERFGSVGVVTWERIQAVRLLHFHDAYWKEWEVFEKVTAAFNGSPPIFTFVQPPEAEEVAISLDIASKIDSHEFDQDVRSYIVASCLHDGLWYFEPPISTAVQGELEELDRRTGVVRAHGEVAAALQESEQFRPQGDDFVSNQVNRVLDVRLVLRRYNEAVERQLQQLPTLVKGS